MGKKGKWFSSVKKAFSPDSKEKKDQKSKKKLLQTQNGLESNSNIVETVASLLPPPPPPPPPPQPVEVRVAEVIDEQNNNAGVLTAPTATSTEIPVVSMQSASEVVRSTTVPRFAGKSKEEVAAIRIQTAFRGYLARRALRALRGLVRLKLLMEGPVVKRQAANTLRCMQTLSRVQSQIRARRIRMSEENQARQRQLLQKHAKELASMRTGEEWDDSTQSKEQIEANLLSKYEATMRRERALAYAYSHQQTWKNSTKYVNPMFVDPSNPTWGWSWLERWMAGRPWESNGTATEKENSNDNASIKSTSRGGEVTKSYVRHQLNSLQPNSPTARTPKKSLQSSSTPSKLVASSRKFKPPMSPRGSVVAPDDDANSVVSMVSERNRRHSIAGSSVRDDESLASSPALPSYMVPTESARAKLKAQSPSGLVGGEENGTPDKGTAKKRLSYPASPAPKPRRFSAPPKVENGVTTEIAVTNGGGS